MTQMVKVLIEDQQTGTKMYRYKKLDPEDHYRHTTNYFYLACQDPSLQHYIQTSKLRGNLGIDKKRVNSYDPLHR